MKLILFLNIPIRKSCKNTYSANFINLIDFFLNLESLVKLINIATPVGTVGRGKDPITIAIPTPKVSILELPYYSNPFELIRISWKFIPRTLEMSLSKNVKKADAVGIVAPGTIFFFSFPLIHFVYKKPIFLIVRGYKKKTIQYAYKKHFLKKIIALSVVSIYDILIKLALKRNKVIMFTIGFNKEMIEKYGHKDKIYNLMPMIPKDLIKKRTNITHSSNKEINILYLGRLSGEKGLHDLLLAFLHVVNERKKKIVLHIVGSGPEEKSLKKQVEDLELNDKVIFHGFIPRGDKLWKIVDSSDIFVLPSYIEGLPRAVFEVMARGVPVICTKVGGLPEVIKNGINGLLIEPGDIISLKNAIIKLIDNPDLRNQLIKEGYKTVEEVTFEKQGKKLIEIIKSKLLE